MFEEIARKIWERYTGEKTEPELPVTVEFLKTEYFFGLDDSIPDVSVSFVITYDERKIKLSEYEFGIEEFYEPYGTVYVPINIKSWYED